MALEEWLNRNVETEQYRSRVRCVALGLGDLKACSEEMLSHALNLDDYGRQASEAAARRLPAQGREVGRRDGRVGRRVPADQARRAGRRGARAEEAEGVAGAPRLRGRRARRGALAKEVVARGRPHPRRRRLVRGALGRRPVRLRRGQCRPLGALGRLGPPRTHLRQVSRRPGIGRRHRAVSLIPYTSIGTR